MPIKIRFDTQYLQCSNIIPTIQGLTDSYETTAVIVREHQPKDHYHIYLDENCDIKTVRKRCRKICAEGNKACTVGNNHDNWKGYISYLMKHNDTEVLHIGSHWGTRTELLKYYNSVKKSPIHNDNNSLVTQLLKYIGDQPWTTVRDLYGYIIRYYLERHKLIHKAHINQLALTIYLIKYPINMGMLVNDLLLTEDVLRLQDYRDTKKWLALKEIEEREEYLLRNDEYQIQSKLCKYAQGVAPPEGSDHAQASTSSSLD